MLLKKERADLQHFIQKEGEELGLAKENLERIELELVAGIRFIFPSHTSQLELIRLVTREVVESYMPNFTEFDLDDIGLAIDEACTNVITHSYMEEQGQGVIKVEYALERDRIKIVIVDEGQKGQNFNPDDLSPVDKEEYLKTLSRGGLGVHIIKKIMDEVEYTVSPGVQNCLTMIKFVNPTEETE